jgi:hypothetical protein
MLVVSRVHDDCNGWTFMAKHVHSCDVISIPVTFRSSNPSGWGVGGPRLALRGRSAYQPPISPSFAANHLLFWETTSSSLALDPSRYSHPHLMTFRAVTFSSFAVWYIPE